jgi:hypothetical protein
MRRCWAVVAAALLASLVVGVPSVGAAPPRDPRFTVPIDELAAALTCSSPTLRRHPEHEPVLLVHGTFTQGEEQYAWNWNLLLDERGYDHCTVTYPSRGLGDQQVAAEYVAYAVMHMHQVSGRLVDMSGHSQGASMPRWAIKYWPSVQADLDDFVPIAGPAHGTSVADVQAGNPLLSVTGMPPALFQFATTSNFTRHVNLGDETPGNIDYTSIYSYTDELVQPAAPVPTAALDFGHEGPHVRNVNVQDVCPGRLVDHLSIGTTDQFAMDLTLDAFDHPGPGDPARVASVACSLPTQHLGPQTVGALVGMGDTGPSLQDITSTPRTTSEPAVASYAVAYDHTP